MTSSGTAFLCNLQNAPAVSVFNRFHDLPITDTEWPVLSHLAAQGAQDVQVNIDKPSNRAMSTRTSKKRKKVKFVTLAKYEESEDKPKIHQEFEKSGADLTVDADESLPKPDLVAPACDHTPEISFLEAEASQAQVNHVHEEGWVLWEAVMDSGAAENVVPTDMATHIPLKETEASKKGQVFSTADGGVLANIGERVVPMITQEGYCLNARYQVAAVTKPLNAISRVCDQGNQVVFEQDGGYIVNLATNQRTWFPRANGVYVLRTWVQAKNRSDSSFARPE